MSPINIGVLLSGGGTNLQSVIDAVNADKINGEVKVVVSNRENAYGLERARKHNIAAFYVDKKKHESNIEFNREIMKIFEDQEVDLIILAGYLQILSKELVNKYKNKIINIHPSLIPSFCGKGFYGLRVHQAVLDYGAKVTGATVQFIDEGTDTGPIIIQKPIEVDEYDTAETLQKKVLKIEHEILVKAISLYSYGMVEVRGRKVYIK